MNRNKHLPEMGQKEEEEKWIRLVNFQRHTPQYVKKKLRKPLTKKMKSETTTLKPILWEQIRHF